TPRVGRRPARWTPAPTTSTAGSGARGSAPTSSSTTGGSGPTSTPGRRGSGSRPTTSAVRATTRRRTSPERTSPTADPSPVVRELLVDVAGDRCRRRTSGPALGDDDGDDVPR